MTKSESEAGVKTRERRKTEVKTPRLFKVILLNDDYTPMDFVVSILESIFNKGPAEAVQLMLKVHNTGSAVCGVYAREIAEAKVMLVHTRARSAGYPLAATIEPE